MAQHEILKLTSYSTLRHVVSLFHVLEKELAWRKSAGRDEGYGSMKASKPIVAVGAEHPLCDEELMADYFRKFTLFIFGSWLTLTRIAKTALMGYTTFMACIQISPLRILGNHSSRMVQMALLTRALSLPTSPRPRQWLTRRSSVF